MHSSSKAVLEMSDRRRLITTSVVSGRTYPQFCDLCARVADNIWLGEMSACYTSYVF